MSDQTTTPATGITPENLAAWEAQYKRIAHIKSSETLPDGKTPEWEIVLRKPTRTEYKFLKQALKNDRTEVDAFEQCVRKLSLSPTGADLDALLDEWPGIPEASWQAFERLAGMAGAEERKG